MIPLGNEEIICVILVFIFNHANVLRRKDLGFFNKRGKYRWRGVYYFQALDNQESLLREIDDAFYGKYTGLDIYDNQFSIANARTFTIAVTWRSFRQIGEMRGGEIPR